MSTPMALDTREPEHLVRQSDRLLAAVCLTLAEHLVQLARRRVKFGRLVKTVRYAKRWCRRPATAEEAANITTAVRQASRRRGGRVACLEISLAAVLMALTRRRSVDWCHGVRMMPYDSHAWIEASGQPIGEPDDHTRRFHLLYRV